MKVLDIFRRPPQLIKCNSGLYIISSSIEYSTVDIKEKYKVYIKERYERLEFLNRYKHFQFYAS